jgi:SynChlorMet cassette radical SAM/SPASM protein ScmF
MGPRFDPAGDRYPTLAVESFETAIREAKPLGLASVKLTGGEPLLHPRFTQLLGIVQREGFRLTIETNGLLCTPEIAAEIAKSPNRFVSVSIDGADAATHEWVRGVPGSFEAARRAVKNLVATGTRPQIIFTVMRGNVGQMEAMVRLAEDLKADSVKFNVVQPTARGENLHEAQETLTIRELVELGQHVEQHIKPQAQVRVFMDFPRAFSGPASHRPEGGVRLVRDLRHHRRHGQRALCPVRHRRAGARTGLRHGWDGPAGNGLAGECRLERVAGRGCPIGWRGSAAAA